VRIIHFIVLLLAASHVWGCASVSVGLQSDGRYILERSEQSADCQGLHRNIWGRMQVIKSLPAKARAEQQSTPTTTSSLFGRWFGGPGKGLASIQQYDRERAHVSALQLTMLEKKCISVEVETELATADAEMAQIRAK
jgi:hypothetical protein